MRHPSIARGRRSSRDGGGERDRRSSDIYLMSEWIRSVLKSDASRRQTLSRVHARREKGRTHRYTYDCGTGFTRGVARVDVIGVGVGDGASSWGVAPSDLGWRRSSETRANDDGLRERDPGRRECAGRICVRRTRVGADGTRDAR